MSGKFNTTSSSLFNNNNKKSQVPDWMKDLADNLKVKDNHIELPTEKQLGAFASTQQVYRPENDASLRTIAQTFNENKLIADSKIQLAKFLSGKYYKVKNAYAGTDLVTLEVNIDGVNSQFHFPYEIKNNKMVNASTFTGNQGEYPFSKPGFEECLSDIKTNKVKVSKLVEAVGKTYVINREEIIRRYNGSLREATEKINSLLNEGVLIGADSNRYATFYDVDQLFPQMEKEGNSEKIAEFHFAPNKEHIATNEIKDAGVLSIEASKILRKNFADFVIKSSSRTNDQLVVKAAVLNTSNNVRSEIDFTFNIVNEKIDNAKFASVGNKTMEFTELLNELNNSNNALNQWQKHAGSSSKRLYDKAIFNINDIKSRLDKVVSASKIERIVDSWIAKGLINPINSTTFTTELSFEDLLSKTVVANVLSDSEVDEIKNYQKHFGSGLDFQRDEKEVLERVREASDAKISVKTRLSQLQNSLTKQFKNFTINNFNHELEDSYTAKIAFTHNNVRNIVDIMADFSDGIKVIAFVSGKDVIIDKLVEAFEKSPVLANYLSDGKSTIVANNIVLDMSNVRRRLANLISKSDVDNVINQWLNNNILVSIGEDRYASSQSFEELLQSLHVNALSESEFSDRIANQKRDKGMEVSKNYENDTSERQLEENWSPERMTLHASSKIGSIFKQYELMDVNLLDDSYIVTAMVVNPKDGLKQKLNFKFEMINGLPKELTKVSNQSGESEIKNINLMLNSEDEAVKHFVESNKIDGSSNKNVINRSRLENQLKTVASSTEIDNIITHLVDSNILQSINSSEFASDRNMTEIVSYLSSQSKTDVKSSKEQMSSSLSDERKLELDVKHLNDADTRNLEAKVNSLSPQMVIVRDKLNQAILIAQKSKKITSSKTLQLQSFLNSSTTEKDLDVAFKELKRFL